LITQLIEKLRRGIPEQYRHFQNYNFSGLKGQTKVSKSGLHFYSSRITLVFSSPDAEFINHILRCLFEEKEVAIGNLLLEPEMVEKEESAHLNDAVKYICISPLVLVSPETNDFYAKKFVSPDTDIFSDLLYDSTMSRMEKTGDYTAEQIASFYKFQIVPDSGYLSKIKEGEKKFARIYPIFDDYTSDQSAKQEVRGYTFPFTLYAAPEVQQFLFHCGLGAYTQNGFGMLDLANSDQKRKTTPHSLSSDSTQAKNFSMQR
jgi:CRISPR-associated endoribonuclease Cas6